MRKKRNLGMARKAAAVVVLASVSSNALALPAYNGDKLDSFDPSFANAILNDSVLSTSKIYQDHKSNVIYVSPSKSKVDPGTYRNVGTVDCQLLKRQHLLTYMLPPVQQFESKASSGAYSPFFDLQYGNWFRVNTYVVDLTKNLAKLAKWKEDNATLIQKKLTLEGSKDFYQQQIQAIEGEIKGLESAIAAVAAQIGLSKDPTSDQYKKLVERYEALQKELDEKSPGLTEKKNGLLEKKLAVEVELISVLAEYKAKLPADLEQIGVEAVKAAETLRNLNALSSGTWTENSRTLNALEQKTVGSASASYSVWGDEQARLRSLLASSPAYRGFAAAQLPIFNVRISKGSDEAEIESKTVAQNNQELGQETSYEDYGSAGLAVSNAPETATDAVFTAEDKEGNTVPLETVKKDLGTGASGTFNALVTQAAYCSGQTTREIETLRKDEENLALGRKFVEFDFSPWRDRKSAVISQEVSFDYDYFLKTEPISVTCRMDISKFMSYTRNAGSSGFLWWRKKWDNTQRTQAQNSGVVCDNDVNPNSIIEGEDQKRADELYQAMMQEMAADFVLNYAKSYQVTNIEPKGDIVPEKANIGRTMGPAMAALCGANIYCQIGSIVLKSADEMFGSQKGKYSNTDYMSGTITRSYSERAYMKASASAQTTVQVQVN